jgi:cytochrome b
MPKPAKTETWLPAEPDARPSPRLSRIWDPFVRIFHWSLVASFTVAWFSARITSDFHDWVGYIAGALVAARLVWGLVGSRYARFSQFVRPPGAVIGYLRAVVDGRERRYLGHNPAGGAMIVVVLTGMVLAVVSGWMMTTDTYYGVDWVENLHSFTVHSLAVLVALHIGGVVLASLRHRENLVAAMFSGRKRHAGPGDIV